MFIGRLKLRNKIVRIRNQIISMALEIITLKEKIELAQLFVEFPFILFNNFEIILKQEKINKFSFH